MGNVLESALGEPVQCSDSERFLLKQITPAVDYQGHGFLLMLDERKILDTGLPPATSIQHRAGMKL
jgi:hypothetical protein